LWALKVQNYAAGLEMHCPGGVLVSAWAIKLPVGEYAARPVPMCATRSKPYTKLWGVVVHWSEMRKEAVTDRLPGWAARVLYAWMVPRIARSIVALSISIPYGF
jgi:hypothetical protein